MAKVVDVIWTLQQTIDAERLDTWQMLRGKMEVYISNQNVFTAEVVEW